MFFLDKPEEALIHKIAPCVDEEPLPFFNLTLREEIKQIIVKMYMYMFIQTSTCSYQDGKTQVLESTVTVVVLLEIFFRFGWCNGRTKLQPLNRL